MPSPRRRVVLSSLIVSALLLAGCSSDGHPHAAVPPWPSASSAAPSPAGSTPPAPKPSPSPPKPKPSPTPELSLEEIIARLPKFGPAPAAVPVKLIQGPLAPIFYRIPTTQKVAFLTMDDGNYQLSGDLKVMAAAHVPFTMFLIGPVAARNPKFFKTLRSYGGVIEDHTMTHPNLKGKPYHYQTGQVCYAKDLLTDAFGRTPTLFRPPYGEFDPVTLKAVHDCGLKAAFHWSETVDNGKITYLPSQHHVRAGDIILMHFRPTFAKDVLAALAAIKAAGLTPALLEDYITPKA